jgi:hypothetical protein
MNAQWREETIALATLVGEEAERTPMTSEEFYRWVHTQNAEELKQKLSL